MPMRACLLIALSAAFATPAVACEPVGEPWLDLEVEAAEYAGPDRTLRVALYDNGCAAVRRPAFHRAPGEYRLMVDTATRRQLALLAGEPALRSFEPAAVVGRIGQRMADQGALFEVHDAAAYRLALRDGTTRRQIDFAAVPEYAGRFPGTEGLAEFAALVDAAHDLANRTDARMVDAGAQP